MSNQAKQNKQPEDMMGDPDDSYDSDDEPREVEPLELTNDQINERIYRTMERTGCDYITAGTYWQLILDGHTTYEAKVRSGLADPAY